MLKTILSTLVCVGSISLVSAQQLDMPSEIQTNLPVDLQNARQGETIEFCRQHTFHTQMMNDPAYVQALLDDEAIRAQEALNPQPEMTEVFYIPIVFHVLHNNGSENISDEQIMDALDILNRDFMLQNSDANNVVNAFNASNPAAIAPPDTAFIQFRMATRAPDGTCFSGITRTVSAQTSSGDGGSQVNAIINGNDVYNGQWAGNRYLNVFICEDLGGAAGYTFLPSNGIGTSMANGIWMLSDYVGSIGTSDVQRSRSLTHEVGHWLNLPHPWGSTNNPGVPSNCNDDDGVDDTPDCQGVTSCQLSANTCSGDNAFWGFDQIDNVENYMDYSYCSKMFTPGQVARMRNAIQSSVGGRNNVKSASNLAFTGADGNLTLCETEFSASRTSICVGESVDFSDDSFNAVTSRTWTFQGGTPATSTLENPTITYNTPGLYEVELTATDGTTTDTETKTAYIRVLANGGAPTILEGFESYTSFNGVTEWEIVDYGNNAEWAIETSAGLNSSQSAKLANFGQSAGNMDDLISEPTDLSGISAANGVTLSFRYSYRKRNSNNDETLRLLVSNNCGETWASRRTLTGPLLGTDIEVSAWTPSSEADWVTVHVTNITSNYWVQNFRYKFEFESDGGNNIYLDNINLYEGSPSDDLIASIGENDPIDHITLYPNPTEGDITIQFDAVNSQVVNMEVVDIAGKLVQTSSVNASAGANMVVLGTETMAPGMYFLKIDGSNNSLQFVVK